MTASAAGSHDHRVVIVGGGFAGLHTAKSLRRAPVHVTVLDKENFHLFQPLLYQVATGGLSPGDITSPIRRILRKSRNTQVLLGEVTAIDPTERVVTFDGGTARYDTLVLAAGVGHHYFGHDEFAPFAPGLKTIPDATDMRRRILYAFEAAEKEPDPTLRRAWLNFVIVGAGPTGVELAGAIAELANDTLRRDFRHIDSSTATIVLLEGSDRVLPTYPPDLSARALRSLQRLGATVRLNTLVTQVGATSVRVNAGEKEETIETRCVLWAAGTKASPLAQLISDRLKMELNRARRVKVEPDLTLAGHPEIFVIKNMAAFLHQSNQALPNIAPITMQQNRFMARVIVARRQGRNGPSTFQYRDRGSLATIGRKAGVADFGRWRFSGFPAWFLWLAVHLTFLIEFENRILVLIQWAWNYVTRNRGARLIVGRADGPATRQHE